MRVNARIGGTHTQPSCLLPPRLPRLQVTKPALVVPTITANATSADAPASILLTAPGGFAAYAWAADNCPGSVAIASAPGGAGSGTLLLTSGPSGAVFNLAGAPGGVACGFSVTVYNGLGDNATSNLTTVTVRGRLDCHALRGLPACSPLRSALACPAAAHTAGPCAACPAPPARAVKHSPAHPAPSQPPVPRRARSSPGRRWRRPLSRQTPSTRPSRRPPT